MGEYMKINYKKLILFIVGTIFVGGFIAIFVKTSYAGLDTPSITPPPIVFPIVWSILYTLMGISLYIFSESDYLDKEKGYIFYILQLIVNALWTPIFFTLELRLVAFIWITLLLILVVLMIREFFKAKKIAAYLQIPYLIWLLFASYLNLTIYLLNR